ncbi:hypothetical protein HZI73_26370 (plasmid) [Vallitalea pronyensis]|uniref:Uncharacterized protein n=1 Tax=Vallitalea pronyensis TaxID=1348613 RepID=A0A8J8MQZ9_9FIRM|nr:hypothetical protein [Vallitalea pronyensis]QUI25941.1 hypothetical protein HZI73_26370 [Vallitalea pronyensis]
MSKTVELIHAYDQSKKYSERTLLIAPTQFSEENVMYQLLSYIIFTAEEIDDHADIETDDLAKILIDYYGFERVEKHEWVLSFVSYELYAIREAMNGDFAINLHDFDELYKKEKLLEALKKIVAKN